MLGVVGVEENILSSLAMGNSKPWDVSTCIGLMEILFFGETPLIAALNSKGSNLLESFFFHSI